MTVQRIEYSANGRTQRMICFSPNIRPSLLPGYDAAVTVKRIGV